MTDGPTVRADRRVALVRCALELRQCGFRVEGIDLARRAVHEEKDGVLCLGGMVRRFRRGTGLAREEIEQSQPGESATDLPEKLTPRPTAGRRVWNETGQHRKRPFRLAASCCERCRSARNSSRLNEFNPDTRT